jgi:hypothetical protein
MATDCTAASPQELYTDGEKSDRQRDRQKPEITIQRSRKVKALVVK